MPGLLRVTFPPCDLDARGIPYWDSTKQKAIAFSPPSEQSVNGFGDQASLKQGLLNLIKSWAGAAPFIPEDHLTSLNRKKQAVFFFWFFFSFKVSKGWEQWTSKTCSYGILQCLCCSWRVLILVQCLCRLKPKASTLLTLGFRFPISYILSSATTGMENSFTGSNTMEQRDYFIFVLRRDLTISFYQPRTHQVDLWVIEVHSHLPSKCWD